MEFTRRNLLRGGAVIGASSLIGCWFGTTSAFGDVSTPVPPYSDEAFFGVWDSAGQRWSVVPQVNYDYAAGLSPVATAAKAGDYGAASAALLNYYRLRPDRAKHTYGTNGEYPPERLPLIADNIWTLGSGELYRADMTFSTSTSTATADVTASLATTSGAKGIGFMLMARRKSASVVGLASRHATSGTPTLTIATSAGTWALEAAQSTYIAADSPTASHGGEQTIVVADSGPGAFSAQTRKGFLYFDLSKVSGELTKAALSLTGSATLPDTKVMVYENKETFDETTRTWANTVQNTLSWQGDPGGFDWKRPAQTDKEFYYQLPRFYFAGPMADAYAATGDESLVVALLRHARDFDTDANSYDPEWGGGKYPRDLDASWRLRNLAYAYEIIRKSPSLDPEGNTALLKLLTRGATYLSTVSYIPTPNHIVTVKGAVLFAGGILPEFAGSAGWRANAQSSLAKVIADNVYDDGGYVESSAGYGMGVASSFVEVARFCKANGYTFEAGPLVNKMAWFLADQTYPNCYSTSYGDGGGYVSERNRLTDLANEFNDQKLLYLATLGSQGRKPDHTDANYPTTRVAVQRTGWGAEEWFLRMNADHGNHEHPDDLNLIVYANDRPLLPEMGTYTYSVDPRSDWLRHTTQSNTTVTIDGKPQRVWQLKGSEAPLDIPGGIGPSLTTAWANLASGWTGASAGARHDRTALLLGGGSRGPGWWLILDTLTPSDAAEHSYEQNWHLLPDAEPVLSGTKASTAFETGTNLEIVPLLDEGLSPALRDGYYSRATYQLVDTKYVSYTRRASGPTQLATLLVPIQPGQQAPVSAAPLVHGATGFGTLVTHMEAGDRQSIVMGALTAAPVMAGDYAFSGRLAYVEGVDQPERLVLSEWKSLTWKEKPCVSADRLLSTTALKFDRSRGILTVEADVSAQGATLTFGSGWTPRTIVVNGQSRRQTRRGRAIRVQI